MAEINLVEAVNLALAHELARDEAVVLLGEDIGANGGVFRATAGLQQRFGAGRVVDTRSPRPRSSAPRSAWRRWACPVAEIQFSGFLYPAIDHLVNHAARLRRRPRPPQLPAGGAHALRWRHPRARAPLRAPSDARPPPGLRVVMPSSPARALRPAARGDPRPRPGDVPRAHADVPPVPPGGHRRRRGAAAGRCASRCAAPTSPW